MHISGRNHKQVFNEINITPLTDIFLVLLIIMMVVAPMMQQVRADIKPPEISSGKQVPQNQLTVELTKDGSIYVGGKPVTSDQLADTLKTQESARIAHTGGAAHATEAADATAENAASADNSDSPEKNLVIRADKATKSGEVIKIFEAARDAGFTKVTVAGEPLTPARESTLQQNPSSSSSSSSGTPDATHSGGPS